MSVLQFFALVCFLCAAILAVVAYRVPERRGDLWGALLALGLFLWLLSETKVVN